MSLSSKRSKLRTCLACGQISRAFAERQLGSAPSLCGRLREASLMAIVASGLLNADSKGFQLKVSCEDVSQAKNFLADVRPESVE